MPPKALGLGRGFQGSLGPFSTIEILYDPIDTVLPYLLGFSYVRPRRIYIINSIGLIPGPAQSQCNSILGPKYG